MSHSQKAPKNKRVENNTVTGILKIGATIYILAGK